MKRTWLLLPLMIAGCARPEVQVGSKVFTEGVILGELATQLAHSTGARVVHQRQLGGTQILWQALQSGEVDVYAEYTGTISQELLPGQDVSDEEAMRRALAAMGIRMSQSLGFSDTYAIGMNEAEAERLGIRKLSDLRAHPQLRFGFSNEFMNRGDGWPGLRERYQLPQQQVRGLEHSLAYKALEAGEIQATELYSTDAEIRAYHLRVLIDDLGYFPPYRAVLLFRADLENRKPEVVAALRRLEGRISESAMTGMNARVKIDNVSESRAAADFLEQTLGVHTEIIEQTAFQRLVQHTREHLFLVAVSLAAAILFAVPLGIVGARRPYLGQFLLGIVGIIQTLPSLALLVFMIPPLMWLLDVAPSLRFVGVSSLGPAPAIIALFLYSLLPIVRNTYTGLRDIPAHYRESAQALGLPPRARLWLVELPLAGRTILAGIKTAAVINVGYATLGGLIGAGGFGEPIITGLRRFDVATIIWDGAVPAAVMALVVQGLFELAERFLVPRGLRLQAEQ
jgi:osmoprotectant transport system permease protein